MMEDELAVIGEQKSLIPTTFDMNLAKVLDEDKLQVIANDLRDSFEEDKASRQDWEETYKGLDLLGFKYQERSQPFQS